MVALDRQQGGRKASAASPELIGGSDSEQQNNPENLENSADSQCLSKVRSKGTDKGYGLGNHSQRPWRTQGHNFLEHV